MYDIVSNIIDHSWIMQGSGEQQYIYYICSALIIIITITFIDLFYRFIRSIFHKGDF